MENNFFPIFPFARASKSPTLCLQKAKKKNGFPFHSHIWWRKMEKLSSMFCVWFRSNLKWHLFALRLQQCYRFIMWYIVWAYLASSISLDPHPNGLRNRPHRHRKSLNVCICHRYTGIDDHRMELGSIYGVYLWEKWEVQSHKK